QLSYLFPSHFEVLGRYSYQNMHKDIAALAPDRKQYSFGVTKYIWEHAFKMQAEVTYDEFEYLGGNTANGWYVRFQIEMGIQGVSSFRFQVSNFRFQVSGFEMERFFRG